VHLPAHCVWPLPCHPRQVPPSRCAPSSMAEDTQMLRPRRPTPQTFITSKARSGCSTSVSRRCAWFTRNQIGQRAPSFTAPPELRSSTSSFVRKPKAEQTDLVPPSLFAKLPEPGIIAGLTARLSTSRTLSSSTEDKRPTFAFLRRIRTTPSSCRAPSLRRWVKVSMRRS